MAQYGSFLFETPRIVQIFSRIFFVGIRIGKDQLTETKHVWRLDCNWNTQFRLNKYRDLWNSKLLNRLCLVQPQSRVFSILLNSPGWKQSASELIRIGGPLLPFYRLETTVSTSNRVSFIRTLQFLAKIAFDVF